MLKFNTYIDMLSVARIIVITLGSIQGSNKISFSL